MVRKQPIPLKETCLQFVCARVWEFSKQRSSCIELEHSPSVQAAKRVLSVLPQTVVQNIYNHIISHEFKSYCKSNLEVAKSRSNSESEIVQLYRKHEFKRYQTHVLYFVSLVLGFDERELRIIEFSCAERNEIFFLSKFGNNVNSLNFQDTNFPPVRKIGWLTLPYWKIILQNASNIQVLSLKGVNSCPDEFFKVIGQECNQLKVLKGVVLGDKRLPHCSECTNLRCTTAHSFMNLFIKSETERNMCCDSLQIVRLKTHLNVGSDPRVFNSIVAVLLNNLPNLKSLGDWLYFNAYLESLRPDEITRTNLEEMYIKELTGDLISILTVFCPKVKTMKVTVSEIESLPQLSNFEFLEDLVIRLSTGWRQEPDFNQKIFNKVVSVEWPTLTKLTLLGGYIDINITSLALQFPMLKGLTAQASNNITWDRKTHFKCLETVAIYLLDCDMSWFESFAATVKYLVVHCRKPFNINKSQILLNVPFPCLESLGIIPFPYDFEFYTSVLKTLPKLQKCRMYMDGGTSDYRKLHNERVPELSAFLQENNLECETSVCIPPVAPPCHIY